MADETEFAMGAEAHCSDGPVGKVVRVIVDPAADTVTHLVIEPRLRLSAARLCGDAKTSPSRPAR